MPAPADLEQHRTSVSTKLVHVAPVDWANVCAGVKTEYRTWQRKAGWYRPPEVVCAYTVPVKGRPPKTRLLVLEEVWDEPLAAISDSSLAAEGFDDIDAFRDYWRTRMGHRDSKPWRPLARVTAFRIRPLRDDERDEWGRRYLERLYGAWL